MNRNFLLAGVAVACVIGLVLFALFHGVDLRILSPQGPIGERERWVIGTTMLLCSFIVIPVFAILIAFAWTYRASNQKSHVNHAPNWDHDSWTAELAWWLGPTLIVIFLGVIAWQTTHELDPFKSLSSSTPAITVQVVALDWKWLFIYPDLGIATVNMVEFPANTPVHFYITSDAPMNSFWIPSLCGQIMAMPGMTTQLNLLANKSGTYNGFSSNMSGEGFAGMTFSAKAVSESEFETMANPLNTLTYAQLAEPSSNVPVSYYSSVQAELYTTSVLKDMMSQPVSYDSTSATATPMLVPVEASPVQSMPGMQMNMDMQMAPNTP